MAHQFSKPANSMVGLFDLRLIIAVLFGIYGVVLTILGIGFTTAADLAKTGGININLWTGVSMLVLTISFVLWALLRPIVVPVEPVVGEAGKPHNAH